MSVLVDPITGWLGGLLGNGLVGLLRGSPDERAARQAMADAVEDVLTAIVDPDERGRVRAGLRDCFTRPPLPRPDGGLREAVIAQVGLLRESSDGRGLFYDTVTVDPVWLEEQVAEAFLAAVDRIVAASSLAEAVHQQRHEALLRSLEDFRALLRRRPGAGGGGGRDDSGDQPEVAGDVVEVGVEGLFLSGAGVSSRLVMLQSEQAGIRLLG
ncbi:hypothetical protein GCM10022221_37920 [Actinocorallia aurea]